VIDLAAKTVETIEALERYLEETEVIAPDGHVYLYGDGSPVALDAARSILALRQLQDVTPDAQPDTAS
jgi:hypothetical protein